MATEIKSKTNKGEFSIISLKHLAAQANISYARLYNILVLKRYDSLTDNEKTHLSNVMFSEVRKAFRVIGFKIEIKKQD